MISEKEFSSAVEKDVFIGVDGGTYCIESVMTGWIPRVKVVRLKNEREKRKALCWYYGRIRDENMVIVEELDDPGAKFVSGSDRET